MAKTDSGAFSVFVSFTKGLKSAREVTGRNDLPIQHLMVMMEILTVAMIAKNAKSADRIPRRTAQDLAEMAGIKQDSISKVLKALEVDYRWVAAISDPNDRRSRHYHPTPEGQKFAMEWAKCLGVTVSTSDFDVIPGALGQNSSAPGSKSARGGARELGRREASA